MNTKTQRTAAFFIAFVAIMSLPFGVNAAITKSALLGSATKDIPYWIYVPSIGLSSAIKGVGIDKKGNMDVPSARTTNVGWYKYGVTPGNTGTAVLDAHVTAAFKDLSKVKLGDSIYIYTTAGKVLRFIATAAHTYEAKTTSPLTLFAPSSNPDLNLITCAGTLLSDGDATHRLIVSARLVA